MASITPNIKNGKIISYKFKSCVGRDEFGKQVFRCTTWKIPDGLAACRIERAAQRAAETWERHAKEDDEFKDEKIFNATIKYLYEIAELNNDSIQVIVVNNGYPNFIPNECVVAEFDSDQRGGLPQGLIDDSV